MLVGQRLVGEVGRTARLQGAWQTASWGLCPPPNKHPRCTHFITALPLQDEAAAAPNLKLLEMAHKWKRQKMGDDGSDGGGGAA